MKRPSFQFYPGDWLRDTALRLCSIEARGLWMDMICYMHEGSPYGFLKVGNMQITPEHLVVMTGVTRGVIDKCLGELEGAGVFSRSGDGTIFSRRMVNDERVRDARAEGGKKGAEHGIKGKEHGFKGGRPVINSPENKPPLQPPPSSSSSSPSSNNKNTNKAKTFESKYAFFLKIFNETTGRKYKGCSKSKENFKNRLNDNYSSEQFKTAIRNCLADPYHKANPNFLTPEFITRPDKLDKYLNAIAPPEEKEETGCGFVQLNREQQDQYFGGGRNPNFVQPDYSHSYLKVS